MSPALPPSSSIAVADLSRRFAGPPDHLALDRLDLTVGEGEFLCLVGPSGSGKTTLLRILAGLDRGFTGKLTLPPGLRSAIVFQEPRLMPWLTVLDNLLLVAQAGDKAAEGRARALLEEVISRASPKLIRASCQAACSAAWPSRVHSWSPRS